MTGAIATPRYSTDDFETASIRSAAPSYISEAPSYHSVAPYPEAVPPYSPPINRSNVAGSTSSLLPPISSNPRHQTIGLPPVPTGPIRSVPNLNNFRIATWSSIGSSPNARQYQRVAQRRMNAQRDPVTSLRRAMSSMTSLEESQEHQERPDRQESLPRPLEDPYLVGEVAAATARQERLARESGDDILLREDRQWDSFLAHMRDWDERDRSWSRPRRDTEMSSRKKLLRRIGGRRLMM